MRHITKLFTIVSACMLTAVILSACANSSNPSSIPEANAQESVTPAEQDQIAETTQEETSQDPIAETTQEETTEEILEEITNFPVLTDAQKIVQRTYHDEFKRDEFYVLPWDIAGTSSECQHSSEEILSSIALGDNIMDVYERIGYPTYRDTSASILSGRDLDYYFMTYATTDGDVISIDYRLAGCTKDDYGYVITAYSSAKDTVPSTQMDFDTKVRLQVIPVFMAVEQVGVDYLLEREIITPYEATLYEAEEAVYQAKLADTETTE